MVVRRTASAFAYRKRPSRSDGGILRQRTSAPLTGSVQTACRCSRLRAAKLEHRLLRVCPFAGSYRLPVCIEDVQQPMLRRDANAREGSDGTPGAWLRCIVCAPRRGGASHEQIRVLWEYWECGTNEYPKTIMTCTPFLGGHICTC